MSVNLSNYTVSAAGCWVWNGTKTHDGYGVTRVTKGSRRVHRLMWERYNGPIPVGLELDHTCENPPCLNPAHLDAVTRAEHIRRTMQRLGKDDLHRAAVNMRIAGCSYSEIAEALRWSGRVSAHAAVGYAIRKGLADSNEIPRRRTVTPAERQQMTEMYHAGKKQTEIAPLFGLHSSQVSRIVRGLTSGHSKVSKENQ